MGWKWSWGSLLQKPSQPWQEGCKALARRITSSALTTHHEQSSLFIEGQTDRPPSVKITGSAHTHPAAGESQSQGASSECTQAKQGPFALPGGGGHPRWRSGKGSSRDGCPQGTTLPPGRRQEWQGLPATGSQQWSHVLWVGILVPAFIRLTPVSVGTRRTSSMPCREVGSMCTDCPEPPPRSPAV